MNGSSALPIDQLSPLVVEENENEGRTHLARAVTGRSAGESRAATRTGARRPFPPPPQHRHGARRVPAHAPHPKAPPPSDQRAQSRHSSFPVPPHAAHRGADDDDETCLHGKPRGALLAEVDEDGMLAMATPASIPSPADATAIAATIFFFSSPLLDCLCCLLSGLI
ncbi:hypothetical protein PR202_ga20568 [Eleusine coracana subsp. coracana]|uniref:Uncharacterized protein n=1 Tax=Eleusine coracana subsp. coracana TaxID=191504 RepID=A0AAV5CZ38_ELECO|nr:hypothetical protein PR202_ga20568 [Eleusine coracana subsp. coracana]